MDREITCVGKIMKSCDLVFKWYDIPLWFSCYKKVRGIGVS